LQYAKQACDECAVELLWQAKDVALLDNYLVMHARRDFDGPRRVLASLVR
jgi:alpha-ketoglutarate-dependent taurine dioxygenase